MEEIQLSKTCHLTKTIDETNTRITIKTQEYNNDNKSTHTYTYNLIHNVIYPLFCDQKRWDFLNANIQYKPNDVIIATYPKCGTTWLEQIVILMKYGLSQKDKLRPSVRNNYDFENHIGKIHIEGSIEQPHTDLYESQEMSHISLHEFNAIPVRVIKTHSPVSLLLAKEQLLYNETHNVGPKIIIIGRNPLDATVSGYHHFNELRRFRQKHIDPNSEYKSMCFINWARMWLKGLVPFGSWFDWLNDWYSLYQQTNKTSVHFLTYESLKQNTMAELKKINAFLGTELSDTELAEVETLTSFTKMKTDAQQYVVDDINSDVHLRKGIVGDWINYFDAETAELYRAKLETYPQLYSLYKET